MNEPLNPCPFCNTTPILQHTRETGFYIHCPTCQSFTHGIEWSREEALAVWNNRPSPWVRIDPERPETLPQEKEGFFMSNFVLVTLFDSRINKSYVEKARYDYDYPKSPDSPYGWREDDGCLLDSPYLTAIAWRSLPEPAVYEESE